MVGSRARVVEKQLWGLRGQTLAIWMGAQPTTREGLELRGCPFVNKQTNKQIHDSELNKGAGPPGSYKRTICQPEMAPVTHRSCLPG